jgi:gluconate 2-dehydrogenase gamma chain
VADYVAGLAAIDALARAAHGVPFASLEVGRQDAVLREAERRHAFFELLLKHTREGMFGDPSWGGNLDGVGWRLIGYGGPRSAWAAEDQRVEFIGPRPQSAP